MTVAMCSSPANYFHLLRRQGLSPVRRPLIAFTPKSLLRHKAAVSQLDDFTSGTFAAGAAPTPTADPAQVRRVLLCAGKVYYDLAAERAARRAQRRRDRAGRAALPAAGRRDLRAELDRYPDAELVWVQEEPANQGAWPFMALNLPEHLGGRRAAARLPAGVGLAGRRLARGARGAAAPRSSATAFA